MHLVSRRRLFDASEEDALNPPQHVPGPEDHAADRQDRDPAKLYRQLANRSGPTPLKGTRQNQDFTHESIEARNADAGERKQPTKNAITGSRRASPPKLAISRV